MGNLGETGCRDDDFDDVNADGDDRVSQEAEPGVGAASERFFLVGRHGVRWAAEGAGSPRFYLDEDEGFFMAADDVDLAAMRGAEITVKDFEAEPAEVPGREALAAAPQEEMGGLGRVRRRGGVAAGRPGEKFCDVWGKGHGL